MTVLEALKKKLQQPYYGNFQLQHTWRRALIYGSFVSLFLFYFEPFDLSTLESWILARVCLTFGAITFFSIIFHGNILPLFFKQFYQEESWNVWKEIVYVMLNFLSIGMLNFAYFVILVDLNLETWWPAFVRMQVGTIAVGLPPVTVFIFYDQSRLLKTNLQKALALTQNISTDQQDENPDAMIQFHAENGKLELEISAHSLLFLKTAGNYIDIHYQLNHQHQTYVLRNRLKNILPILNQPNFYQCHRSYLVNLDKVTQVTGNARGLELHLEGFDKQLIPVSRSKSQELEKLLHALK